MGKRRECRDQSLAGKGPSTKRGRWDTGGLGEPGTPLLAPSVKGEASLTPQEDSGASSRLPYGQSDIK